MGAQVLVRGGHANRVVSFGSTIKSYTAGQVIGVPTAIPTAVQDPGQTGVLESLTIFDAENQKGAVDIIFFQQLPTSQGADGAAYALNATELLYVLGRVSVLGSDYASSSAVAEATKNALGISLAGATKAQGGASAIVYCLAVARASITFASTGSLKMRVGILQD